MTDEDLMEQMGKIVKNNPEVVLAEFPMTSTEIHKIANGDCCVFNNETSPFSIRFLLQSSFKSPKSNFVINKYVIQVVATQKQKFMRKEDIAVKTKIIKTQRKHVEKVKPERVQTKVIESNNKLF